MICTRYSAVHVYIEDAAFDPSVHPRGGNARNAGEFSSRGSQSAAKEGKGGAEEAPESNVDLTSEEKSRALHRLEELPTHEHPWRRNMPDKEWGRVLDPQEVGFKAPSIWRLGGVSHPGKGWYKTEKLGIGDITNTQPFVPVEGARSYIQNLVRGNRELPMLAQYQGDPNRYVISGHTRLTAQALAGRKDIPVRTYYFNRNTPFRAEGSVQVRPGAFRPA